MEYLFYMYESYTCTDSLMKLKTDVRIHILLVEVCIITVYTVAHLHVVIVIIHSVIYISPFTNDDVIRMTLCVLCTP